MKQTTSLTVGFDAKRAALNRTGLGNYSRLVIDELSAMHPDWKMRLYTPRGAEALSASNAGTESRMICTPHGLWKKAPSLWRLSGGITGAIKYDGVDIYHGLSNELPLDIRRSGVPSVVTIHDVIYRRCPDNYTAIDRRLYDWKYGRSAQNATRVIAISERTKADIVELYQVDSGKIDVVYQSCHPQFSMPVTQDSISELRRFFNLPARYIAAVGTVERRKNQMLIVNALPKIDPEVHLVIVGRGRQGYDAEIRRRASRLGVESRIHWLSELPFSLLPAIYAGAETAAYVSRYEGFGLPVVEAISAGTPVIAATGSCLEEAGGEGALYVHPDDTEAFAAAANRLLESPALRHIMVEKGREHIARTLSTPMAEAITATYRKALEI